MQYSRIRLRAISREIASNWHHEPPIIYIGKKINALFFYSYSNNFFFFFLR